MHIMVNNLENLLMKMKTQIITLAIMFIGITMFAQNNNDYQYDNLNRLTRVTFPNGTVYEYTYDQLGNRTQKVINATAAAFPDLLIQNQSVSQTTMAAGASINATFYLANTGNGSSGGHYVKCYLSANQTYEQGTDVELSSVYNSGIAAGTNTQLNSNITIPQGTAPGSWYILFFADATNLSTESNETNNVSVLPITIVNCANIQTTSNITHATCGLNNGVITITPNGGYTPYTYQWSNGQTAATANNLSGNTYTVTITDFYGCVKTSSATVNTITPPSITLTSTNATCGANNGTASVSASNGTSPYQYTWSNGQNTSSLSNLAAGNYSVTVTDANSCSVTGSTTINTPANLSVSLYPTSPTCGSNNGVISAAVSGGTQPYTYLWSNGQTGSSLNNIVSGNYTVTLTDANNCQFISGITLQSSNNMVITTSSTNATCGNANGTATVSVSNGTSPYIYTWINGQSGQTANSLVQGSYNVTVTDANNCQAVSYATVTAILPPTANLNATQTACSGNTGSITATISNGTAPYTYSWSNGGTTQTISNLGIGIYTVTVTDANTCTNQSSAIVQYDNNGSNQISVSLGNDITACVNEVITIDAGAGFASYLWSNGSNSQSLTLSGLNTGVHEFSVTAYACGNYSYDTIIVQVNPLPDGGGVISGPLTLCQGVSSVTYTIPTIPNVSSYVWSFPVGVTGSSSTNSIILDFGLNAESGNITVAGVNNCGSGTPSSITVAINALPTQPIITLNSGVLLSNAPLGNQWYYNETLISGAINQYFIPTQSGDYYSIVTLNGCSSDLSNTINFVITDVETTNLKRDINIYPNPVSNELTIEVEGNNEQLNFEIINAIGQVIYCGNLKEKVIINTDRFASGVYVVKLVIENKFEFKKIIIE